MKKAVFSDLDGTLLRNNHKFSWYTKRIVKKLQKRGVHFVIATGRLAQDAIRQAKKLAVHKYDGYVIGNNGAVLYSFKTNTFLWMMTLTKHEIQNIFDFTYQRYKVHFFSADTTYVYEEGKTSYYWSKVMKTNYKIITDVKELDQEITHASIICHQPISEEQAKMLINQLNKLLPSLDVTQYNNRVFEISCKGISKGSALRFLTHHLGVDFQNTYSFGDSYNDIELIKQAGMGIAVDNAINELKVLAEMLVKSNEENGPARYLHELLLKNKL